MSPTREPCSLRCVLLQKVVVYDQPWPHSCLRPARQSLFSCGTRALETFELGLGDHSMSAHVRCGAMHGFSLLGETSKLTSLDQDNQLVDAYKKAATTRAVKQTRGVKYNHTKDSSPIGCPFLFQASPPCTFYLALPYSYSCPSF